MAEDKPQPQKYHYVYEITNIYNGMRYFGARTSKNLPRNDTKYMGSSKSLKKAIKEEGLSCFSKLVLAVFPTREKSLAYEVFLHKRFNVDKDPAFYNKARQTSTGFSFSASGPDHPKYGTHPKGRKLTEEEKEKLRLSAIKANTGKKRSEESKQKQSNTTKGTHMGENHHMYGKHPKEKTRKKLSEKRRKKIRPLEFRKNMSKARSGEKNPQYGKPLSQEHRDKIGKSLLTRDTYIYVTPIGEFSTASSAAKALQCFRGTIIKRCKQEFEGYSLKLARNMKKEEFENLYEKGFSILEIEKIINVRNNVLYRWKHEKEGTTPNGVGIKLTPTKVLEIRYLYDIGAPMGVLEKEFDLGRTQIYRIGKRQNWTHIPEELSPIDPSWQKNYCC